MSQKIARLLAPRFGLYFLIMVLFAGISAWLGRSDVALAELIVVALMFAVYYATVLRRKKATTAYLDELMRMGASVPCNNFTAWFPGNQKLHASSVTATDLRGGAAMVIAALMAEGTTEIKNIHYIDRGYDDLIGKLREVGACIVREEVLQEGAHLSTGSSR